MFLWSIDEHGEQLWPVNVTVRKEQVKTDEETWQCKTVHNIDSNYLFLNVHMNPIVLIY